MLRAARASLPPSMGAMLGFEQYAVSSESAQSEEQEHHPRRRASTIRSKGIATPMIVTAPLRAGGTDAGHDKYIAGIIAAMERSQIDLGMCCWSDTNMGGSYFTLPIPINYTPQPCACYTWLFFPLPRLAEIIVKAPHAAKHWAHVEGKYRRFFQSAITVEAFRDLCAAIESTTKEHANFIVPLILLRMSAGLVVLGVLLFVRDAPLLGCAKHTARRSDVRTPAPPRALPCTQCSTAALILLKQSDYVFYIPGIAAGCVVAGWCAVAVLKRVMHTMLAIAYDYAWEALQRYFRKHRFADLGLTIRRGDIMLVQKQQCGLSALTDRSFFISAVPPPDMPSEELAKQCSAHAAVAIQVGESLPDVRAVEMRRRSMPDPRWSTNSQTRLATMGTSSPRLAIPANFHAMPARTELPAAALGAAPTVPAQRVLMSRTRRSTMTRHSVGVGDIEMPERLPSLSNSSSPEFRATVISPLAEAPQTFKASSAHNFAAR